MKPRAIVTAGLLIFVAVSVVYLIAKEAGRPAISSNRKPVEPAGSGPGTVPARNQVVDAQSPVEVIVYYFHGNFRCASCKKIEAWTQEAAQNAFAKEIEQGRVEWRPVNIDTPGNEHFVHEYRLYTKSVILAKFKDGNQMRYKNLEKIWRLLHSRSDFEAYISDEIASFLREQGGG
ncbi:MAG: nitrophenyl compound nitroreductase subunit ArsF family protein [Planctomycetota bacterium]|nr:nitrophenyl compound nitroreductase subunit ArsF family protein [Planctomycetota bacterium]